MIQVSSLLDREEVIFFREMNEASATLANTRKVIGTEVTNNEGKFEN